MFWIALQPRPEADTEAPLPDDARAALGWWALQFTPRVALQAQAVLLEVSASERLFGGREPLLAHLLQSPRPVAAVQLAHAPTALLALAYLQVDTTAGLPAPDLLPLATLAEAQAHLATLERIGCRRWGDLRALPRGGVVRRFGAPLLDALDRAYGLKPEVYPWLVLPEVFDLPLELSSQVETAPALLFAARRMLVQLQAWLQARQRGILALELGWQMDARRDTATHGSLVVRTAEPTLDMGHLQRLLSEHLARTTLAAPALALRMRSLETAPLPGASASLLPDELRKGDSLQQLLERLSARLGPQQVLRAVSCADHRPEHMQRWEPAAPSPPASAPAVAGKARRPRAVAQPLPACAELYPSWLLAAPLALAVHQDRPLYQGPLTLLVGPQRLEAGWWVHPGAPGAVSGSAPALRDYFLARSEQAGLVWVYRERLLTQPSTDPQREPAHWYLHGLYA